VPSPFTPLITIGITCYNAADTIARAIDSALSQDWPDFEIVIVDDCSTDETIQVLKHLEKENPTLIVMYQTVNGGVATTRNKIIQHAKGDFIAFFDDDDFSDPQRLRKQYERIISYEEHHAQAAPVICHTARTQIYPDGSNHYEVTIGTNNGAAPHDTSVAERILTGKPVVHGFGSTATCSQMARTSLYKQLQGFDENFKRGEDTDFNIRAAIIGAHFVGISDPLVTQTMTKASDKSLEDEGMYSLQLLEKHKTFIETKTSYQFCYQWLVAKYDFLAGRKKKFILKLMKLTLTNPVRTLQRLYWSLPNICFNLKTKRFHNEPR